MFIELFLTVPDADIYFVIFKLIFLFQSYSNQVDGKTFLNISEQEVSQSVSQPVSKQVSKYGSKQASQQASKQVRYRVYK